MQEIPFSIPLSGIVRINNGEITISVNRMETTLNFVVEATNARRILLDEGETLNDLALTVAKEIYSETGLNRFHPAELYHRALRKHAGIKRNSFLSRIVACTPDPPSNKYCGSRKDFFRYGGKGILMLNEQYMPIGNEVNTPSQSR